MKTVLAKKKTQMASTNSHQYGFDDTHSEETDVFLGLRSGSSNASDTFGAPTINPRIGCEYQAQLPQFIRQTRAYSDKRFLLGSPITLTRMNNAELGSCSSSRHCRNVNRTEGPFGSCYHLVPGFDEGNWNKAEKECFILGLYIFEKDFVNVRKFVGTKEMGEVLLYYYGKFYSSPEYHRWSECRMMKREKRSFGWRMFSGTLHQQYLSRILPLVPEDCQNALLEESKKFGNEKTTLADYIFSLKAMFGTNTLVEAVGIGKGEHDLTRMALEPQRPNQAIQTRVNVQTQKRLSSLSTKEIIEFLNGDVRLSKARSNDIFWEAVWPRLLARGWHSEQPRISGSKPRLVFLIPSVESFSRGELVKGDQYFDSVSDILSLVARQPGLIEIDSDEGEEYEHTRRNDDDVPTSHGPTRYHNDKETPEEDVDEIEGNKDVQENSRPSKVSGQESEDCAGPTTEQSPILIGRKDRMESVELMRLLTQVSKLLGYSTSVSHHKRMEKSQKCNLIDLNLPCPEYEEDFFAVDLNNEQGVASEQHEDQHCSLNMEVQAGSDERPDLNQEGGSTRIRPQTSRDTEAALGNLKVNRRRKRKEAS